MQIIRSQDLTRFNSLNLLSSASYYTRLTHITGLTQIREFINQNQLPSMVLGGGSNIILPELYTGLIIQNELLGISCVGASDTNQVLVKAYAGENWDNFVAKCISSNYYGLENLSYIPGSVGASPIQNIGAYGVEVKDYIVAVELYNLVTGQIEVFNNKQCQFGYRDSIFKHLNYAFIIISVTYKLSLINKPNLSYKPLIAKLNNKAKVLAQDVRESVIAIRQSRLPDPKILPNAGSFFHNIIVTQAQLNKLLEQDPQLPFYMVDSLHSKVPSAYLIERLGLKGYKLGNIGIYPHHALVVVNYATATQRELLQFAQLIIDRVSTAYALSLKIEPVIIT